jgi:hypothetical protein
MLRYFYHRSQDSSVDTVTSLRVGQHRNCGSITGRGKKISPPCPDLLWGPRNFLSNGYLFSFSLG